MSHQPRPLRLTELMASLSLATDLGTGQPMGHAIRTCLTAVALARHMGCTPDQVRTVHAFSLLRFLGCTADSSELAIVVGGDDLSYNASMAPALNAGSLDTLKTLVGAVAPTATPTIRLKALVSTMRQSGALVAGLTAHCEVASMLARRLGLPGSVSGALAHAYERWDGKGYPTGLRGDEVPIEVSISAVARDIDLWVGRGLDPRPSLTGRRGKAYDPSVVDAFLEMEWSPAEADLDALLDLEPKPVAYVDDLDRALTVVADFADLKSTWLRGHSRLVAGLASDAAAQVGLTPDEAKLVERAGLVHDVGRVGIENGIWDKPGPLTLVEHEKVQTHPYLSHRILARCPSLVDLGSLAASHHERLDGSGYHRQLEAVALPLGARLLAAADVYAALATDRPHRAALSPLPIEETLAGMVDDGRLDAVAVKAVLTVSGHEPALPSRPQEGLSARELEVLRLLVRGRTNRQIGDELFISPKTVGRHIENIYAKIGVSTRAAAAIFAVEHGLL